MQCKNKLQVISATWLSACYILVASNMLCGQAPFFKTLIVNRENPNLAINCLLKDQDGFLYFGTSEGLYKSDGVDESLFPTNRGPDDVTTLCQDIAGKIWVGCRYGKIFTVADGRIEFPFKKKLTGTNITVVFSTPDSNIYIGTSGDGLFKATSSGAVQPIKVAGFDNLTVYDIKQDDNKRVWVTTNAGIHILSVSTLPVLLTKIDLSNGLPDSAALCLSRFGEKSMMAGLQKEGLCLIDINTFKVTPVKFNGEWMYGAVNKILLNQNEIWIGTEQAGLLQTELNPNPSIKVYCTPKSAAFYSVSDLIKDDHGNIWMATNAGLIRSHGNWLTFLNQNSGQSVRNVHTIFCDSKKNIWFSTDNELNLHDAKLQQTTVVKFDRSSRRQKAAPIMVMCEDKYGFIWLGTAGSGLWRFDPVTRKRQIVTGSGQISKSYIQALEIVNDSLWIATRSGLYRCALDPDYNMRDELKLKFEWLPLNKMLRESVVNDIFFDSKQRVWIATEGRGLISYSQYRYIQYNQKSGFKASTVNSIVEDRRGQIWLATKGDGVLKFDGTSFTKFDEAEGIRERNIPLIACDSSRIIVVHKRGIDVISNNAGIYEYFGVENNISNIHSDLHGITKTKDGKFYIGTDKGIIAYNPNHNAVATGPKIILQNVYKNEKAIDYKTETVFPYEQYSFTFDFAGLWFTDAYRIKYRYMLEAYNRNWIPTKEKSVTFSNLPPGKYKFRVSASLNNKFENAPEAVYAFTIKKPFWRELWFIALVIFSIMGAGYFYVKGRDARIKEVQSLENEKINFQLETLKSQVNPHFLFNSFNTLISIIEKNQADAVEYVENLSQFFRNMVFYRDKDLITLYEEFNITDAYYFLQQKRYKENLIIDIKPGRTEAKAFCIAPLTLQMLVENAVKHNAVSKETPLIITVGIQNNRLVVSNNINQKLKKEASAGLGLQNISSRYKLLSGKDISIEHNQDSFTVTIPLIPTS